MASPINRSSSRDEQVIRQAKTDAIKNQTVDQIEAEEQSSTLDELNQIDQEDIEDEIGLEEVEIDSEDLNAIIANDVDDNEDLDNDGVVNDRDDDTAISDLPQELTQSYGTGLQGQPTDRSGRRAHLYQDRYLNQANAELTGGDVDANYEQANAVGDEAVGGTVATPDQDVVDDLGAAVGLEVDDRSFLRTNDMLTERDDRRWELDPKSAEDYQDRRADTPQS